MTHAVVVVQRPVGPPQQLFLLFHDEGGTPGDLAATIYHHMGVPRDTTYLDHQGRPRFVVDHGEPIRELVG